MLPSEIKFGFVTGSLLYAVADGPDDDRFPDGAAPADAAVVFRPVAPVRVTPEAAVIVKPVTCRFTPDGRLRDPEGGDGVWLVAGQWDVQWSVPGHPIPTSRVEVTSAHSVADPLSLVPLIAPSPVAPLPGWRALTQAQYDAISLKDPRTLYLIVGEA